ncbi:hypothetical protein DK871_10875 [Pseudomonas sp. L13]|nr:hypothetical protein [Pseudomonas sp. L13]
MQRLPGDFRAQRASVYVARFCMLCRKACIDMPGLSRLYAGEEKKQGWLLGYSSLTAHEIETAMRRLARAIGP